MHFKQYSILIVVHVKCREFRSNLVFVGRGEATKGGTGADNGREQEEDRRSPEESGETRNSSAYDNLATHSITHCVTVCCQAEEQLRRMEVERQQLEDRQRREDEEKKREKKQQEVILNKKKARPKLSFSLNSR